MKRNNNCDDPKLNRLNKIFGVGLKGAGISIVLLFLAIFINQKLDGSSIINHSILLKLVGAVFVIMGIAVHLWTAWTLRNWWIKGQLCIVGPFKYFRHPMYAAWITFISFGTALFLNSWVYIVWAILLHPIRKCCRDKALSHCAACNEQPCEKLNKFHEFSPDAKTAFGALLKQLGSV